MAVVEGLFCVQTLHFGPVYLAVISQLAVLQGWPLRGVPLYMQKYNSVAIIITIFSTVTVDHMACLAYCNF